MAILNWTDPHSASNTNAFHIKHLHWDFEVCFESSIIKASANYDIHVLDQSAKEIILDASNIDVKKCHVDGKIVNFTLFLAKFGGALKVLLPEAIMKDRLTLVVEYSTTKKCSALQWLPSHQTLGKLRPFLFSQCQAIHARSLIPIQDTPSIKFTFEATVNVSDQLVALMGAKMTREEVVRGGRKLFTFHQAIPIPSYLLALAVGNLKGRKIGPRSTVWTEPELIEEAACEFEDTELFLKVAEDIAGPYVWGFYDILVLPPSFPYGGMENPCLTFLSPSLIAHDRSLVDVVAHEIAHSWTGNLVTNADWSSFWLNEGFTMYLERRIIGKVRGQPSRHFDACLGLTELRRDIFDLFGPEHPATALTPNICDTDPDDAYSRVPYEKGHTFLFYLESIINEGVNQSELGPFGEYLKAYFQDYAYQSITVGQWKEYLLQFYKKNYENIYSRLQTVDFDGWLFGTGMPPVIPSFDRSLGEACEGYAKLYILKSLTSK